MYAAAQSCQFFEMVIPKTSVNECESGQMFNGSARA